MHVSTQDLVLFGKVPDEGDFVRHNATGPVIRALDTWIRQGLYLAKSQGGLPQDGSPVQVPTTRFYFDPGSSEGALLGALHPSRDRVGRSFPFLAAAEVEAENVDAVTLLPITYRGLLDRTTQMVREAATGKASMDDLLQTSQQRGWSASRDASTQYDQFLRRTTLYALLERLWGYADDSRTYLLFKNLLDIVLPLRSGVPTRFSLVLRFPLSEVTEEQAFEATFWMQLTLQLTRQTTQPSFFWMDAGDERALLFTLRPPPDDVLIHLTDPRADTEHVCKLEQMGTMSAVQAALAIPSEYGTLIESDSVTLSDVLQQV